MYKAPAWALAIVPLFSPSAGFDRVGKLSDPTIRETSGIVASRKHPGVFWILSDSGNPPVLHAIRRDGKVIASVRVAIPNLDWEDIATDNAGHLYIGEIGNNGNRIPLRAIYRVNEPDPERPPTDEIPVNGAVLYRFTRDQARFDAESLFVLGSRAYVISKRLDGKVAELYALDVTKPTSIFHPSVPTRVGIIPGFVEAATGADLSADGRRLAVCSISVVRVYNRAEDGGLTLRAEIPTNRTQIEAISWDGLDLILANEAGELFRIAEATWSGSRGAPP